MPAKNCRPKSINTGGLNVSRSVVVRSPLATDMRIFGVERQCHSDLFVIEFAMHAIHSGLNIERSLTLV